MKRKLHFLMPGPATKQRVTVCGRTGHLVVYESGALVLRGNGHSSYCTTKVMEADCVQCSLVLDPLRLK